MATAVIKVVLALFTVPSLAGRYGRPPDDATIAPMTDDKMTDAELDDLCQRCGPRGVQAHRAGRRRQLGAGDGR